MKYELPILDESYEKHFFDKGYINSHASEILLGLAAAINECDSSWKPKASEIEKILEKSGKIRDKLINAGLSYNAAKRIQIMFPGPAILLYGAAIQAIAEGSYPNEELKKCITAGERKLQHAGLSNDEDIKAILNAAKERARFDKTSELMRREFSEGLKSAGKPDDFIAQIVQVIVNTTHDTRHRGIIDKTSIYSYDPSKQYSYKDHYGNIHYFGSMEKPIVEIDSLMSSDPFTQVKGSAVIFHELTKPSKCAALGCAYRILNCINKYR